MGEIRKETASWLKKSESALQAAESLQKQGLLSDNISRAYYAMFFQPKLYFVKMVFPLIIILL